MLSDIISRFCLNVFKTCPVRDGGEGIATHQDVEKVQRNGSLKFSWPKTLTKAACPGNSPRSDGEEMDLGRV